jgi:rod shape-determining protein MreC
MESFFVRYRNFLVLLAMLVAQMIGLAVQVRRTPAGYNSLDPRDGPGVRLIRLWADALVSPPERLVHGTRLGLVNLWQNYVDLRHTRQQNEDLQKTIDRLRLEQAALLEDARQGQRLQAELGFQQKYLYATQAAQVFGTSGSDQSRVFYIDKGSADKLERDMAVISPEGIVGKVRDVFPHSAQVLAINDPTSGAGVILETTRTRGILRGNAAGQLQIVGLLADQRIQPGEKVLTAGGDQIFPRGLPVGAVEKVVRDPDQDSFIIVYVKPAAHLDQLDEVLVITATEPRFSPQQQEDLATSETLKGAEAAALAEQKKASEIRAERLPGLLDPNLPPDQQPLYDSSLPTPVSHPPVALQPDRFTPGAAPGAPSGAAPASPPTAQPGGNPATPKEKQTAAPKSPGDQPAAQPQARPSQQSKPERMP